MGVGLLIAADIFVVGQFASAIRRSNSRPLAVIRRLLCLPPLESVCFKASSPEVASMPLAERRATRARSRGSMLVKQPTQPAEREDAMLSAIGEDEDEEDRMRETSDEEDDRRSEDLVPAIKVSSPVTTQDWDIRTAEESCKFKLPPSNAFFQLNVDDSECSDTRRVDNALEDTYDFERVLEPEGTKTRNKSQAEQYSIPSTRATERKKSDGDNEDTSQDASLQQLTDHLDTRRQELAECVKLFSACGLLSDRVSKEVCDELDALRLPGDSAAC